MGCAPSKTENSAQILLVQNKPESELKPKKTKMTDKKIKTMIILCSNREGNFDFYLLSYSNHHHLFINFRLSMAMQHIQKQKARGHNIRPVCN